MIIIRFKYKWTYKKSPETEVTIRRLLIRGNKGSTAAFIPTYMKVSGECVSAKALSGKQIENT